MSIELRQVTKKFGDNAVVNNVTFSVKEGELMALLGPSGGGKTTVLRMIAGLEMPTAGDVFIRGRRVNDLSVQQRNIGFVFQNYALFKNMTVFKNIAFGLKIKKWKRADIQARIAELLKLFGLEGLERRYPHQLSGGQRQRVAIARALAPKPTVLLLDEPFGAVDAKIRQELREWLVTLHHDLNVTTIFVTHDQEEALEVSDRVAILRDGKIEQIGTPEEIYDRPASPFVYDFLGNVNLFSGRVKDGAMVIGGTAFAAADAAGEADSDAVAFVRPHDIRVTRQANGPALVALVIRSNAAGPVANLELKRLDSGEIFTVQLSKESFQELSPKAGEQVFVELKNVKIFSDDYSI